MFIRLYITPSEPNRLDKELTHELQVNGSLRDECSVITPVIEVNKGQGITNYNYVYIPNFGRYYFITDITAVRTDLWRLQLQVDPLMSFKEAIKNVTGIAQRNENEFNLYISDPEFSVDNRSLVRYSKIGEFTELNYYLTVLGGYSS